MYKETLSKLTYYDKVNISSNEVSLDKDLKHINTNLEMGSAYIKTPNLQNIKIEMESAYIKVPKFA